VVKTKLFATEGASQEARSWIRRVTGARLRCVYLRRGFDAHTHLLENYRNELVDDETNMILTVTTMSAAKRAPLGVKMGREELEAGITTVRDLGNSGFGGDVALRDAIDAGWVVGPRIRVATRALAAAGGQFGTVRPEAQRSSSRNTRS